MRINLFVIDVIIIYTLFAYLFQGIPWLLNFGLHDWKDNLIAATGCAVFPFMLPFILASQLVWNILKILFAIVLVLFLIPAYFVYWIAKRLLVGGTLFKTWFKIANGLMQGYIDFVNTLLGSSWPALRKIETQNAPEAH